MHYAIIGFGCAGYYAARTIRENDPEGQITVFSEHDYAPYNPMLTTYYAAGKIPVVIHRRNRRPWLITLHLSDFLQGVKQ